MSFLDVLDRMIRRPLSARQRRNKVRSFRPFIEFLELRCVPTIITPTTFADGVLGSGSLRDAVLQFNADAGTGDDTIQLLSGTYALTIRNTGGHHETAGLTGDLNLTQTSHHWIIEGAGPSTIIDAGQLQDRVFQIVNPGTQVVFQDLVIQGGLAQDDGSNDALAGTTDALGGGILNNGGNVTLDHVLLQNNVARGGDAAVQLAPGQNASGGALYSTGGALTLAGATITNNQVTGGRGGNSSQVHYPARDGGSASGAGLYVNGGSLDISDSRIANNRGTGGHGGDGGAYVTSSFLVYLGGRGGAAQGGGLYVNGGSLTVASSTIASDQVTGGPAGVNGFFDGGGIGGGLCIFSNAGTATVTGSTLSGNSATVPNPNVGAGVGGGIVNGGTLTVSNSTLAGNSGDLGGGIANFGTLTVSSSTLAANSATSGGGGIFNNGGTLTVSKSTLSGNSAVGGGSRGGGIYSAGASTLTVSNSTLSGNSAGIGGGIGSYSTLLTLTNVTFTANRAGQGGGGLFAVFVSPVLHNTLIAGNFRGATGMTRDDVSGTLASAGDYNLIGDGSGMGGLQNGVNGNLVGSAAAPIDPLLGPLQGNGGPTLTHALLAGSPALNAGSPAQLGVPDQRGVVRSGGVNIGAYQASASAFVLTVPGTVAAGTPFDVTIQVVDVFGQVAFGYTGTVTFLVTDPDSAVVLPLDYTFTADDAGTHTFTGAFILITPGDQTLTVADLANGLSIDVPITVNP